MGGVDGRCRRCTDWLTPSRLSTWLRRASDTGRKDPAVLHAHLTAAARGAIGPAGAAAAEVTRAGWQDHQPSDPDRQRALQTLLTATDTSSAGR